MKHVLISLIIFTSLIQGASWAEDKKANLITYDHLAKPGEKVFLMAKLKKGGFSVKPEISGERIEFFQNEKSLGIALTGTDGTAVKEIPPLRAGLHRFTSRLADTKRYTAEESEGIVACWDQKKPIIVIDIDTLSEKEKPDFIFGKKERDLKPLKDAPQVLKKLSRNYNIIYLTGRDELILTKTRYWLKEKKFPSGPIFPIKAQEESLEEEYSEIIKGWKKEGWDIRIGIGSMPQHAEAYLENGMKAIILEDEEELPEKAVTVKGWKEIEKAILKLHKSHKAVD